jgi:beta-glucanase (GH16 family)
VASFLQFSVRYRSRVLAGFWLGVVLITPFAAYADWQLVWSDEFNGTSLNTNVWHADQAWPSCINGGSDLELYTNNRQTIQVTNGYLRIIGNVISTGGSNILNSARIMTWVIDDCTGTVDANMKNPFVFTYGAVEFRAKLPIFTGAWPALWMDPWENPNAPATNLWDAVYGPWPLSGELDVMEDDGNANNVSQSIHSYGFDHTGTGSVTTSVTNWHIYRLEWYTNQINWQVDGITNTIQTNWGVPPGYSYPAPFDAGSKGFYIIMNLALGGAYVGNPSMATIVAALANSALPEMDIDYVRVYKQGNPVLSAAQTNKNFIVSWFQQPSAWVLQQQSTALNKTWTQVPVAQYQTNQSQILFSVPESPTSNMFYRLIQQ